VGHAQVTDTWRTSASHLTRLRASDHQYGDPDGGPVRVLVIGSGGREHAIVTHLARHTKAAQIFAAPGNPGIGLIATNVNIAATDASALERFARAEGIDIAIVGPESALAAGVADAIRAAGVKVLGPSARAARLETSKVWTKQLLAEAGIPTAVHARFTDSTEAIAYCRPHPYPLVVKADGLAAGKGAIVCETFDEAKAAIINMLDNSLFGDAGSQILIEDFLVGEEFTQMVFTDGVAWRSVPISQDHKRVFDSDKGPNTGGMGAYSPVPTLPEAHDASIERIFVPLIDALQKRGIEYHGVLCGNLIWTADGPHVIEFNARFGDPEAEVTLPLLETDLTVIVEAIETGTLGDCDITWSKRSAVCVALTAAGYPGKSRTGDPIHGLEGNFSETDVFHAGTQLINGAVSTDGGRVLIVTGTGDDLPEARRRCYERVRHLQFDGMHYRRDIAWRAIKYLGVDITDFDGIDTNTARR
jgi:phosphoribosylamine--glycine ligase